MPTIEITPEDARALARGEDITIKPQPKAAALHIAVHRDGVVYVIRGPVDAAEWKIIRGRGGSSASPFEKWQNMLWNFTHKSFAVVPIDG